MQLRDLTRYACASLLLPLAQCSAFAILALAALHPPCSLPVRAGRRGALNAGGRPGGADHPAAREPLRGGGGCPSGAYCAAATATCAACPLPALPLWQQPRLNASSSSWSSSSSLSWWWSSSSSWSSSDNTSGARHAEDQGACAAAMAGLDANASLVTAAGNATAGAEILLARCPLVSDGLWRPSDAAVAVVCALALAAAVRRRHAEASADRRLFAAAASRFRRDRHGGGGRGRGRGRGGSSGEQETGARTAAVPAPGLATATVGTVGAAAARAAKRWSGEVVVLAGSLAGAWLMLGGDGGRGGAGEGEAGAAEVAAVRAGLALAAVAAGVVLGVCGLGLGLLGGLDGLGKGSANTTDATGAETAVKKGGVAGSARANAVTVAAGRHTQRWTWRQQGRRWACAARRGAARALAATLHSLRTALVPACAALAAAARNASASRPAGLFVEGGGDGGSGWALATVLHTVGLLFVLDLDRALGDALLPPRAEVTDRPITALLARLGASGGGGGEGGAVGEGLVEGGGGEGGGGGVGGRGAPAAAPPRLRLNPSDAAVGATRTLPPPLPARGRQPKGDGGGSGGGGGGVRSASLLAKWAKRFAFDEEDEDADVQHIDALEGDDGNDDSEDVDSDDSDYSDDLDNDSDDSDDEDGDASGDASVEAVDAWCWGAAYPLALAALVAAAALDPSALARAFFGNPQQTSSAHV